LTDPSYIILFVKLFARLLLLFFFSNLLANNACDANLCLNKPAKAPQNNHKNTEKHVCAVICIALVFTCQAFGFIRTCSPCRVLLAWSRHTVSEQRLRYREAWFQYSSEMRLLTAVFMQWRRALIQGQQKKCTMESQLIIYQRRAFHRWRTAATECRVIQTLNNRLLHKV